jgi:hypothetical protein
MKVWFALLCLVGMLNAYSVVANVQLGEMTTSKYLELTDKAYFEGLSVSYSNISAADDGVDVSYNVNTYSMDSVSVKRMQKTVSFKVNSALFGDCSARYGRYKDFCFKMFFDSDSVMYYDHKPILPLRYQINQFVADDYKQQLEMREAIKKEQEKSKESTIVEELRRLLGIWKFI